MIIGVTGQMGAGKTLTAQLLSKCLDAKLIELDSYIHSLYKEEKVKKFLQRHFGEKVFATTGEILRKKLGKIVFSDKEKLNLLNKFFDVYVYEKLQGLFKLSPESNFLIDGAIILQNSWRNLVDKIVLVKADQSLKKKGQQSVLE
jgi:dephospho-CoA kinase